MRSGCIWFVFFCGLTGVLGILLHQALVVGDDQRFGLSQLFLGEHGNILALVFRRPVTAVAQKALGHAAGVGGMADHIVGDGVAVFVAQLKVQIPQMAAGKIP